MKELSLASQVSYQEFGDHELSPKMNPNKEN